MTLWRISLMVFAGLFFVLIIGMILYPSKNDAAVRECDRQVAGLLSTKDMVELDRAKFLIKWFNCGISERLQQ